MKSLVPIGAKLIKLLAGNALAVVAARALSLVLFAVSARLLSSEGNAGVIFVTGVSALVVHLGTLGWLTTSRKMAARFDLVDPAIAKGFLIKSFQIPIASILLVVVAILAVAASGVWDKDFSTLWIWTALASLPLFANVMLREYLAGLGKPVLSTLTGDTLPLGISVAVIILLRISTVEGAVLAIIGASFCTTAVQLVYTIPRFRTILSGPEPTYETRAWVGIATLAVVGSGGKMLIDRLDSLLLAPIAGLSQLAHYNSALRLTNLLMLMPAVLLPVFAARVGKAFETGNIALLQKYMVAQLALTAAGCIPFLLILAFFPTLILQLVYGPAYGEAADYLIVITLSQSLFAMSLPFSNLLVMADGERPYAMASVLGLVVNVAVGLLLIPTAGACGAAWAALSGTVALSLVLVLSSLPKLTGVHR